MTEQKHVSNGHAGSSGRVSEDGRSELSVVGMGNPLLDVIVEAPVSLLSKYGLEANCAILAEEKHMPLFEEVFERQDALLVAGGATQNSIRICQAMLNRTGQRHRTAYCGCVGVDKHGHEMKELLEAEGVLSLYARSTQHQTGICAVLVSSKGANRSLVTSLGAANDYLLAHLQETSVWNAVSAARIFYSSGFFLTVCPEAMLAAAKHCWTSTQNLLLPSTESAPTLSAHSHPKKHHHYCLNLAAPFILDVFVKSLFQILPYVDFLFGNEAEFQQLARSQQFQTESLTEIARRAVELSHVSDKCSSTAKGQTKGEIRGGPRGRVVIITQGSSETIVASRALSGDSVKVQTYPILPLEKERLVDTNGAGDAFVGGFLFGLAMDKDIDYCISAGHFAAHHVIQQSGCTFNFKELPRALTDGLESAT